MHQGVKLFQWKKDQNFHICLRSGPRGLTPSPTVKRFFSDTYPDEIPGKFKFYRESHISQYKATKFVWLLYVLSQELSTICYIWHSPNIRRDEQKIRGAYLFKCLTYYINIKICSLGQRGHLACDPQWHSIESSGIALRRTPEEDNFKINKMKFMIRVWIGLESGDN